MMVSLYILSSAAVVENGFIPEKFVRVFAYDSNTVLRC